MGQTATGGLRTNQRAYQHCFIGHSQAAPWRETFEQVCEEVLPHFGLKPWYADRHYQGSVPLRQKVVNMIATTRYGIYDLSYWRVNDQSPWTMPRNVLIELGMAIALNRPMLLLRHGKNRESGLALPACLEGIEIGEFGDGKKLLKQTLYARLPSLTQHTPQQDWLNRYCHFGALQCSYRETHPHAQQWGRQKIHIHISDGANTSHIDCSDFRDMIEEDVIARLNNLEFNYLDSLASPQGCKFLLCSRCQEVRSSPFAIYRITPHTSADTFIAIGMSIALEKQFNYAIPKILITEDADIIPSLLKGYEIIVERNYVRIKDRLNTILPQIIEEMKQTTWKPQPLPFEVFLPEKEIPATKASAEQEEETVTTEASGLASSEEKIGDIPPASEEDATDTAKVQKTLPVLSDYEKSQRERIFIIYSQKDKRHFNQLQTHLARYEHKKLVDIWNDTKIAAGTKWRKEIEETLASTRVAILLVSADFLASRFIDENVLPPLLQVAQADGAIILPVILSPCVFEDTPLAQFQTFNSTQKPLSAMRTNDKQVAWANLARYILTLMKEI